MTRIFCDKRNKKDKYESKVDSLVMFPLERMSCSGEMLPVTSEDGSVLYGRQCSMCGAQQQKCFGCGRMFANLESHVAPKMHDGELVESPCAGKNPHLDRLRAVNRMKSP